MKRFSVLIFVLFSLTAGAQQYAEIGLSGGCMYYLGDLNPGKHFQMVKPAFGGFLRHNFNERLAVKAGLTYGHIAGDDAVSGNHPERNLNFESSITDISATFEFNFFDFFIGSQNHNFTPYMHAGASAFLFNPKGSINGSLTELRSVGTEGQGSAIYPERKKYGKFGLSVPFGIGVKYSISNFVGLSLDWTLHKATTDYLDDVSTTYYLDLAGSDPGEVTQQALLSDPTLSHNAGMQRGDSQYNDWFSIVGLSVSFRVNYFDRQRCLNIFY